MLTVLKIGGSCVWRSIERDGIDDSFCEAVGRFILALKGDVVVTLGVGHPGRAIMPLYDNSNRIPQNASLIGEGVSKLTCSWASMFCKALNKQRPLVQSMEVPEWFKIFDYEIQYQGGIPHFVGGSVFPLFPGGTYACIEGGYRIVSSDEISAALAIELNACSVIWLSNVDGVMTKNGERLANLTAIEASNMSSDMQSNSGDPTGGMKSKLAICGDLATRGIPSVIINGSRLVETISLNALVDRGTSVA